MASNSATSLQKTFKLDTYTLFARGIITNATGAVSTVTSGGASKEAAITRTAAGKYTITWANLPVNQFLGYPVLGLLNSDDTTNEAYPITLASESGSAMSVYVWKVGETGLAIVDPPSGSSICVTAFATTSPVF